MNLRGKPIVGIGLAIAAIAFGSASLTRAERASVIKDRVERSFVVKPGALLTVKSNVASAHILTGNSDSVHVEIERAVRADNRDEAAEVLKELSLEMVEENGGVTIVALVPDRRNDRNSPRIHLDARITIPRKFNLDLRTVGRLTVEDLDGTAHLSNSGGGLKVGNISGPVTAKSAGGSITIGDVGGDLEARSGGGSIKAGRVAGRVLANAGGGSVSIDEATDAVEATAEGGSVSAYISRQPGSDCKITANAGSIDLRLTERAALNVDAACTAGGIRSDFPIAVKGESASTRWKGNIGVGGPSLFLRASAGNITLRKGAP